MPNPASSEALQALTDWWQDMGVEVDSARIDALMRELKASSPVQKEMGGAVKAAPKTAPRRGRAPTDWVAEATKAAAACDSLEALKAAIEAFEGCPLKAASEHTVVYDGVPGADLMVIGEGPGAEEDRRGLPFVGRSGQLLDRMLAAIGLDRTSDDPAKAAYITNVLPWRPVGNRDPSTDEAVMLWAFLERHIQLAAPDYLVALGKSPAAALLETPVAITRMRGRWVTPARTGGKPLLLTFHPAYLLRQPMEKSKSWRDLLSLRAVLDGAAPPVGN